VYHAQQAVRPFSIALALFGLIAGLAGIVLVGQAITRAMRLERNEQQVLRAFGTAPRTLLRASILAPAVAILAGSALAVVLAIAASAAMPIGPVRRVRAGGAFNVDGTVLGLGALAFVVIFATITVVVALRNAPHRQGRRVHASRPSFVVGAASSAGMEPVPLTGLRFTFERADATRATTPRAVMVGGAIAIAALVAAATFGASLHTLVDEPHLYGWNWDVAITFGDGYDNFALAKARPILDGDSHIEGWSGVNFGAASLSGAGHRSRRDVSLLGMNVQSAVSPPILQGRMLRTPQEIVLGPATAAQLGVGVGDDVTLTGESAPTRMHVVGIATFPTIGQAHAAHTSLGVGAIVVPTAVPGHDRNILGERRAGLGPNAIFVRYRPGTNAKKELAHLQQTTQPLMGFGGLDVYSVQRPAEIVNSRSLGSAPLLLAIALSAGALLSLALALGSSVRHRRRDLTVMKSLGFTQRQLGATVAWHATTMIVVALVIGVPVGIAAGRFFWSSFADALHVVAHPVVPALGVGIVILAAVVVANVVAAVPARVARRVNPRALLRGE
jgi:ABC-type lipoprotein release transport system permease subunit